MRPLPVLSLVLLFAPAMTGCFPTVDPARLPTREEVAGTWLALSRSDGYRLELLPDGRAELVATYDFGERESVHRYTAAQWQLDGYDFFAKFLPVDGNDGPIYMRGWAAGDSLVDVNIGSSSSSPGPRTPEFLRESRARDLMKALTEAN